MRAEGNEHTAGHHTRLYRSADIALVAGGNRKRWIIATEKMQAGDIIKTSGVIGRMAGEPSLEMTDFGQSVLNANFDMISFCFTLQSQPMRGMHTHWELFLWGHW